MNEESEKVQEVLSLRLGDKHFSFVITNKMGDVLYELVYCSLGQCNEQELAECKRAYPVLSRSFYKVMIAYDHARSLIMPSWCYEPENSSLYLKTMAGDLYGSHIVSEQVSGWQLNTVYGMPKDVQDWMNQQFPYANSRHQYSLGIKSLNATSSGYLLVDFRTDDFILLAAKGSSLLIAQTFSYSTPEDVLFYLLKTCDRFELTQQDVQLRVSGLIDRESTLYKELSQYFIDIEFRDPSWGNASSDHPSHFFTLLNDLAKCAS